MKVMYLEKYKPEIKKILYLLLSFAIVLALHCKFQVFPQAGNGMLVHFMSKLSNSFASYNFTDIFVWFAVYFMIRYVEKSDKQIDIYSVVLAAVFSLTYIISRSYLAFDSLAFITKNKYQIFISTFCFIVFFVFFYLCIRTLLLFLGSHLENFIKPNHAEVIQKRFWLFSFAAIFICWLPWICVNYPCTFCPDSTWQLMMFFDKDWWSHHPPLSTYIMGFLVSVGKFIWTANFGCFLYLVLQTFVGALVFSYGIQKLYVAGIRLRYCIVAVLFFALTPFWGCFAQWFEKDLLFTEIITLFLIFLIDIVNKKECNKKDAILLTASGILASLLRHNGIYAVLPSVFALAFYINKQCRKKIWISFFCIMFIYGGFEKLIYPALGVHKSPKAILAFTIPFQQTARYVSKYGDEVTEYEKAVIDSVIDYNAIVEKYNPKHSDPINFSYRRDDSKIPEYLKVWFKMFWKHPGTYISAFVNGIYGYIAPVQTSIEPGPYYELPDDWLKSIGFHRVFSEKPALFFNYIKIASMYTPLVKYLCIPGMYTWILLICMMVLLKKKFYGVLIIFIPEIMNILVCMASPLSNSDRYELPTIAAMLFLIGWTILFIVGDKKIIVKEEIQQ